MGPMKARVKRHEDTGYYVGFVGDPATVEVVVVKTTGDWETVGIRGFGMTFMNDPDYALTTAAKEALDKAVEQYPDHG